MKDKNSLLMTEFNNFPENIFQCSFWIILVTFQGKRIWKCNFSPYNVIQKMHFYKQLNCILVDTKDLRL